MVWYHHYHDGVLLPLLPVEEDHCCGPLCSTFTEQHLWPYAITPQTAIAHRPRPLIIVGRQEGP